MQMFRRRTVLGMGGHLAIAAFAVAAGAGVAHRRAAAAEGSPYIVEVADVTAKVGEHAVMLATVHLRDGYRVLGPYDHRLSKLSSLDDAVAFGPTPIHGMVRDDGAIVFTIDVSPTKAGTHPINGVFRFGYIKDDTFMMVSAPLMAKVTGTE